MYYFWYTYGNEFVLPGWIQGNDDDWLWPVCYHKTMGGPKQGMSLKMYTPVVYLTCEATF